MKKKLVVLVLLLGLTFVMPINNDYTVSAATTQKVTTYKITYKLNGGVNNKKNPVKYKKNKTIKLMNPTKKGYVFKGWYSNSKLTKKVTSVKNKNITLYAKWSPISYTVKYNGNGGKGKISNLTNRKYNKSFKLSKNKYSKKGYVFVGWNTRKDGKGKVYKAGSSVKNLTSKNKSSVTLYAMWKNKFKISYVLNGGVNNKSNPSTYKINTGVVLKNPTRSGYKFLGWYRDAKFKNKVTSIKKGYNKDIKLYAKWQSLVTPREKAALDKAREYAKTPISRAVLIEYLMHRDDYTNKEAVYAADHLGANWNTNALNRAKVLLRLNTYSKNTLIDELSDEMAYGYTLAQATYAANNCGANWNELAYKRAQELLNRTNFSKEMLRSNLSNRYIEGFTASEADYAINKLNLDYKEQALEYAQKELKSLRNYAHRSELKVYLVSVHKYTEEEALYAVNNAEYDWSSKVELQVNNMLASKPYSKVEVTNALKQLLFTDSEIEVVLGNKDWYDQALRRALNLSSNQHYSKSKIILTMQSEKYTDEQITNAFTSFSGDSFNKNALYIANNLTEEDDTLTAEALKERLVNEYLFTETEADYAIDNCENFYSDDYL